MPRRGRLCYRKRVLIFLFACSPEAGTYLLETTAWSTTCRVGGGHYEEPAAQYQVEVYVEAEGALWLDDVSCVLAEWEYACEDAPIEQVVGSDAQLKVSRLWVGEWTDALHMIGQVDWGTRCEGTGCESINAELCDASWSYSAVNVGSGE